MLWSGIGSAAHTCAAMPIQKRLAYAALARRGDATISERRALLEAHRDEVARTLISLVLRGIRS